MTPEQEQQIFEFMGRIDERTENMEKCAKVTTKLLETHDGRICNLEAYKNEMVGKISIIAVICGAVGWAITSAISYYLGKG